GGGGWGGEGGGGGAAGGGAGRWAPPVYSNAADSWDTVRRGFVVVCDSLAHFLTTLCLQEAVMGCRNLAALDTDRPPAEALAVPLEPLWLDGYYVAGEPDHQFYVSPERDLLIMDRAGLWIGSPTRKAAELVGAGVNFEVPHGGQTGRCP